MNEEDVSLNFKGGGSISSHPPFFSEDAENVFVCWKNSLLQYSTKTGKIIHEYKGLSSRVVGFTPYNYEKFQCLVSCSESGEIMVWKTITHYKIFETHLPVQKVNFFHVIPSEKADDLKALISYTRKGDTCFAEVDIKEKNLKECGIKLTKKDYFIDVSRNKYFSIACDSEIYFVAFSNFKNIQRHRIHDSRNFTCLACHPTEEVVLTGDNNGRVLVWQNIFSKKKTQEVFHWHTLPVRTVCFSTSGSYFYSGGSECVIVKWQFHNVHDRQFVPRIAAEIEHISVAKNNLYLAVATSDNAVRIFNAQLNQVALIQHLVLGKQYNCGIIYDPRTKALIMNGNQGHVQFYSPSDMSLLYSVDIVGQNKITNERDCMIQNTEITRVAVNRDGLWLATVEERKDKQYHSEMRLKFWKFLSESQTFGLNTCVEYPHESSINSLLFQPISRSGDVRCVTVGNDKKFKVWQLTEVTTVYKKDEAWKCLSVGFFRDLRCCALSFSTDGSLLATAFETIITTWTPDTCELKCSLAHPWHREKLRHVQFGNDKQSHLLVAASANQLSVWNLLTLCMVWTVPIGVGLLVADPLSTHMVVVNQHKEVYVFSPASSALIYTSGTLLKKQDSIVAAAFVPNRYISKTQPKWYQRSHLYFITSSNELYCVSGNESTSEVSSEEVDDGKLAFGMLRPVHQTSLAQSTVAHKHLYEKDLEHKTLKKYLEAPIHTMTPIRYACYGLLRSLIVQKGDVS